jgi:ferrochelatase
MVSPEAKTGILLLQLGTPASPAVRDVRRYLREFLSDPLVIDLPAPARWMLVNLVIAPFRAPKSAAAYQQVWTDEGSPLLVHSNALAAGLAESLGPDFVVALGMRYGEPQIRDALARLAAAGVDRIVAVPLFPHDAQSSSGSAAARTTELHAELGPDAPPLAVLGSFPTDPGFIGSFAEIARPILSEFRPDHVLFSYHGLPERHIRKADPSGQHCLSGRLSDHLSDHLSDRTDGADGKDGPAEGCCAALGAANRACYRAQCFATTRALCGALGLEAARTSTSFQSRLGRDPWIRPFTDFVLPELAASGVRRLAVLCPSFVADCLETVEEIGIRGREQWRQCGGEELALIPCVNAHPSWVGSLADRIRNAADDGSRVPVA